MLPPYHFPFHHCTLSLLTYNPNFPGNRPTRSQGLRTRATDPLGCRGQERARLMGPLRRPSQAAPAEGTRRHHHRKGHQGAREPQDPAADPDPERRGRGEIGPEQGSVNYSTIFETRVVLN